MMADPVLLSICIPTFNRSEYLRVMLEALLPQVAEVGPRVEVWVSDNASTDDTGKVVEDARALGPVKYSRNASNLGPLGNIVKPATQLATGEYVWMVGDHNLFAPGALASIVSNLEAHSDLDTLYVNFRVAVHPRDWPSSAMGGYAGPCVYLANDSKLDQVVDRWSDHVHGGRSALCTQMYAHIIRRELWLEYWSNRGSEEAYTSAETTYPHTVMLARMRFASRSMYIGAPSLTIFNGAQSWGAIDTRLKVYFRGLPELIDLFAKLGLPESQMTEARLFAGQMAYETGIDMFTTRDYGRAFRTVKLLMARGSIRHAYMLSRLSQAFIDAENSWVSRVIRRGVTAGRSSYNYIFHHSRPARSIRSRQKL
jgi:glycosyltransferase involved in cell wall biosynthesis